MGCNSSKQQGYESHGNGTSASHDDPKKSAALRAEALKVAEEMMALSKGKRFHEFYTRLTLTSYGASCKVLTAYHRTTNKKVAVKTIPKARRQQDRQRQKVMLEIGTFRMVEDHPNAVRVLEIFEGAECYYIVMECCEGGELFDHISKKQGCFTERQAAQLLRSLMLFLAHMHSKGIAHLDIKPENIMFDSEGANGVLKVLDFGSAVFVQPSETVRNAFGTVRYASPEMANDVCGQKADIWSAGVVMYILLSGRAPFLKSNDIDTLNLIKGGPRVKFSGERWASISHSAKDCIKVLLEPDPRVRPTAVAVLAMPWLKQQVPETVIVPDTLQHLRTFANQSRIRRLLLGLMADQLVGSGANQLLGQFYTLDKDFSGTLEVAELVKAAQEAIPDLSELEINRMFEALDVDRTGTVDVKEFFAGLIQTIDEEKQTLVAQKSFTMLDKRGAGFVTKEAFMEVLLERAQAGTLKTLAPKGPEGAPKVAGEAADAEVRGQRLESAAEQLWAGRQSGLDGGDAQVILDPGLVSELEQEFANLDANGDGVLSFEEFKAILGIQATPEGLTLTQPQLTMVPSIQEGMETLAQTLARTRTASRNPLEDRTTGQVGNPTGVTSRIHSMSAAAATAAAAAASGSAGAGAGCAQSVGGPSVGRLSNPGVGGARVPSVSLDRAQLDLELPTDWETRDLLQLLAPAKRTTSHLPNNSQSQQSSRTGMGRAISTGGLIPSATTVLQQAGAASVTTTGFSRLGANKQPNGTSNGPKGGVADLPVLQQVTSMGVSRTASSVASIPTMLLLDKAPSMRAPSLPPLNRQEQGNGSAAAAGAAGGSSPGKDHGWDAPLSGSGPTGQSGAGSSGGGGAVVVVAEEVVAVVGPLTYPSTPPRRSCSSPDPQLPAAPPAQHATHAQSPLPSLPGGVASASSTCTGLIAAVPAARPGDRDRSSLSVAAGDRATVMAPLLKGVSGSSNTSPRAGS